VTAGRRFRDPDDATLLFDALSSWIAQGGSTGYDHPGDIPHRLYNGMRGRWPLAELCRVWEGSTGVEAMAMVYPPWDGFDVFVAPGNRGTSVEEDGLAWSVDTCRRFRDDLGRVGPISTDVHRGDLVRASLLRAAGFSRRRDWMAITRLPLGGRLPARPLPAGFSIRTASRRDAERLAEVHAAAFGSSWTGDLYRREVMDRPIYRPSREHVVVAGDGSLAAFAVTWVDERNGVGLFEPVGTHPRHQRRGLAAALMTSVLARWAADGLAAATVAHEIDDIGATALYRSLGFVTETKVAEWFQT
jgi:mycothiol synthase